MFDESPQEEVAEIESFENGSRWKISRTKIVLGLLMAVHVAFFHLYFIFASQRENMQPLTLIIGALFSQPILFSFWAAFAPQRFYHRFLWCFLLCTIVSFIEELGWLWQGDGDSGMLMIVTWILFLLATAVLLVIRRFTGWQIQHDRQISLTADYQASQFGIKHLLILTSITGLAAGLFRSLFLLSPPSLENYPSAVNFAGGLGILLAILFPVVLLPWFTLAYRARAIRLVVFSIIIFAFFDSLAYWLAQILERDHEFFTQMLLIQLGAGLSMLVTTLPFRFCGYRMVRS